MILHGYWRSGTSYRTRIALNLKGLAYEAAPVDLRTGEQRSDAYLALNPQGLVPALETDDGLVLTQSPAILEWLIGCDIHPLNNLRVLKAVKGLGADQAGVDAWAGRWITDGFAALEALVVRHGEGWCFGGAPTLADCYLIPQIYSARRFNVDLTAFPRLLEIEMRADLHSAFIAAHPDNQPDAD
jgi:glutathione S-transferase